VPEGTADWTSRWQTGGHTRSRALPRHGAHRANRTPRVVVGLSDLIEASGKSNCAFLRTAFFLTHVVSPLVSKKVA
jgi:hypothetical protein